MNKYMYNLTLHKISSRHTIFKLHKNLIICYFQHRPMKAAVTINVRKSV